MEGRQKRKLRKIGRKEGGKEGRFIINERKGQRSYK